MPFMTVNGAEIFYETFGKPQATDGQPPVLLIHGSTQTGRSCWQNVVAQLESQYFVILPDCRGHGQSNNPQMTYTFKEHASDMAGLIRALGFERAHIVGHSNGGNVALLTLMEQPEVTQTCLIQAGNAWVSPDLVEKEPPLFDPDFIERERPAWLREMRELHSGLGAEYWRDLVRLTLAEIISQPNYTPDDLAAVTRPVLLVQGADDHVNAPTKHAEFMARHIPASELWVPKGVSHNVHEEVLNDWLAHVTDFWARRGDPVSDALYRYKMEHYPDGREGVFEVRLTSSGTLTGEVSNEALHAEARRLAGPVASDALRVLITPATPWALVNRPVDDLRRGPNSLAERISQLRLGEAVRILESGEEWSQIQVAHDGYSGWVHSRALHPCSAQQAAAYQANCTTLVSTALAEAYDQTGTLTQKIPFATLLNLKEIRAGQAWVELPDGRLWRLASPDVITLDQRPGATPEGIQLVLNLMRRLVGVPYLWGGRTPYGFDCSGFSGTFYACLGIVIPRDADQQFMRGQPVEGPLEPGDLVFFGEALEDGLSGLDAHSYIRSAQITHVGISLGDEAFIHANGADWGVSYGSFDPQSALYSHWLGENYRGARRFR